MSRVDSLLGNDLPLEGISPGGDFADEGVSGDLSIRPARSKARGFGQADDEERGRGRRERNASPIQGERRGRFTSSSLRGRTAGNENKMASRRRMDAAEPIATRFEAKPGNPNPLVRAAMPLLLVASRVSATEGDARALHQHAVEGIRRFERDALDGDVSEDDVLAARYVLCAFFDEAVLTTPWGGESTWSNRSLLFVFHNETWGGEKVFQILNRAKTNPQQFYDLIEFVDVVLALGFEGRFRVIQNGRASLAELRDDNYDVMRRYGGEPPMTISVDWRPETFRKRRRVNLPVWITALTTVIVLGSVYTLFEHRLFERVEPVVVELEDLIENPFPTAPVPGLQRRGAQVPQAIDAPTNVRVLDRTTGN